MNLESLMRIKSERGKQVSYINAYMWNLEKMVLMNLLENGFVDTAEGKGRANWESSTDIYTPSCT